MIALENILLLNIKYLRFFRWKVLEIKGQNVGVFFSLVVMVSFREAGSGMFAEKGKNKYPGVQ